MSYLFEEHAWNLTKYQPVIVNSLARVDRIVNGMHRHKKFTEEDLKKLVKVKGNKLLTVQILLQLISQKTVDVYDCFLHQLKQTKQMRLYRLLQPSGTGYRQHNS